jgi:hypothetical protein
MEINFVLHPLWNEQRKSVCIYHLGGSAKQCCASRCVLICRLLLLCAIWKWSLVSSMTVLCLPSVLCFFGVLQPP